MRDQEIIGLWEAYQQVHSQPQEEVEVWVNQLLEEGYDLSDYTWEEMYEAYANLNEARTDPRGRPASGPMSVYGGRGRDAGPGGSGNEKIDRMDAAQRRVKSTQPAKKGMAADALFTKYSARQKGMEHGGEEGPGPKAPKRSGRSGRGANTDRGSGNAAKRRMSEDFDLFDTILEHLVAEGYADTNECALVIMVNMSEEWRHDIVEKTAMSKRGYDETEIRNKIVKSTGGGESADRATELENRPIFGNKSKKAAREKLARTQRGDFRKTTSSSSGLHGYGHKSDDPEVKEKQAARGKQRGALTPKEKKQLNR